MQLGLSFGGTLMSNSPARLRVAPLALTATAGLAAALIWAGYAGVTAGGSGHTTGDRPAAGDRPAPGDRSSTSAPAAAAAAAQGVGAPRAGVRSGPPLTGTFTLWGPAPVADPCAARAAAPDIHGGSSVTVRSAAGARVAATVLTSGHPDATHRGCVYGFVLTPLPADLTFSITVGLRTGLQFTPAEVAATKGRITLNLGLPA